MNEPVWSWHIEAGLVKLDNRQEFLDWSRSLPEKGEAVFRAIKSKRSANQRKYYFGVIVKTLCDFTGYSKDEMNEYLKAEFNPKTMTLFDNKGGGTLKIVGQSIEGEKTDKVETIYSDIREWAYEFFGLTIPLPHEVDYE